jgi:hypothetical protein
MIQAEVNNETIIQRLELLQILGSIRKGHNHEKYPS